MYHEENKSHGSCFLTFLKENGAIILNCRSTPIYNDFTFVSSNRESSVSDYQFCPAEHLQYYTKMRTLLMSEIVNLSVIHPTRTLPNCMIMKWRVNLSNMFWDDLNGRRPQWKQPQWKTASMEDNLIGRRRASIEQDLNER